MKRLMSLKAPEFFLLAATLAGNVVLMSFCAFRGFYLFDFGIFLDAAWRMYCGQQIYVDFFFIGGPIHLYMLELPFHLFGFTKVAIFSHLLVVGFTVIIATFQLARNKLPFHLVAVLVVLSATGFYTNRPHPWYNHTAHMWGILGVTALVVTLHLQNERASFWGGLACGIAAGLSLMTKVNIGGAYGLIFGLTLLCSPQRFQALAGCALGSAIAIALTLLSTGAPLIFFQNITGSMSVAQVDYWPRLTSPTAWFRNFYWFPALVVGANLVRAKKFPSALAVLFFGLCFVALFSINTGSERYPANVSLMSTYLAVGLIVLWSLKGGAQSGTKKFHSVSIWILFIFTVAEILFTTSFAIHRATTNRNPVLQLPRYRNGDYQLKAKGFRGWRFHENDGRTLDAVVTFVNGHVAKDETLLITTDLYVVNGLTGRDPYRGIPFDFSKSRGPDSPREVQLSRERIIKHPPDWILTHKEPNWPINQLFERIDLTKFIAARYHLVKSWGAYAILKKRTSEELSAFVSSLAKSP